MEELNKNKNSNYGEYYVYMYSDPTTGKPFYIGKGKDKRVESHLNDSGNSPKACRIKALQEKNLDPQIDILIHDVDEETALKVESAVIDLLKLENLDNLKKGKGSSKYGRKSLKEFRRLSAYEELDAKHISEPIIIIRINQRYHKDISPVDLYDVTRGIWRIDINRVKNGKTGELNYKYALAVYQGEVKEVYEIKDWYPAFSTFYAIPERREPDPLDPESEKIKSRYEFIGKIAPESIRQKLINKIIPDDILPRKSQYPIIYYEHGEKDEERAEVMCEPEDN